MSNEIPTREGRLEVPGGSVWYKVFGAESSKPPLLVTHGGPGFPHNYLLPLADLADERQVIFWDQLGCGNSDKPEDTSLWRLERSLDEVDAVVAGLGLDGFHIFGNSWGGMLVQQWVLDRGQGLLSASVSNSLADMHWFQEHTATLVAKLPEEMRRVIARSIETEDYESEEYEAVIKHWFDLYCCRLDPWPQDLWDAYNTQGFGIYMTMIGPNDFHAVGNLKDWTVLDRLHEIEIPTYFIAGKYDECSYEQMWEMHKRVDYSEFVLFRKTAHMPFHEERELFIGTMRNFLARNDG